MHAAFFILAAGLELAHKAQFGAGSGVVAAWKVGVVFLVNERDARAKTE